MPARRCSVDGVSFPANPYEEFSRCPVCGEPTAWFSNVEPDPDWAEKAKHLIAVREEADRLQAAVPHASGELNIYEEAGLLWVNQSDLINAGIRRSREKSLWLFGANGLVYEAQGWDEPRRRWWIEQVTADIVLPETA